MAILITTFSEQFVLENSYFQFFFLISIEESYFCIKYPRLRFENKNLT